MLLTIEDDGKGFDARAEQGMGLLGHGGAREPSGRHFHGGVASRATAPRCAWLCPLQSVAARATA